MTKALSFLVLLAGFSFQAQALVHNPAGNMDQYYRIDSVVTTEVPQKLFGADALTVVPSNVALGACQSNGYPFAADGTPLDPLATLDMVDMAVDKIINIGRKIWNIVQAGKPYVDLRSDVATALPQGARCWLDLQTWQRPQSKVFSMSFRNGFGSEVVKLSYRVIWLPGGSVDGKGAYIGYAALVPTDVKVSWGFKLSAQGSVPTIFNMGTREAPVAGMQMAMIYRIETPIQTHEQSQAYFISGKGEFEALP